jgi:hypothetical protein
LKKKPKSVNFFKTAQFVEFGRRKRKLSQGWNKLGQPAKLLNKHGLSARGLCPALGQIWDNLESYAGNRCYDNRPEY